MKSSLSSSNKKSNNGVFNIDIPIVEYPVQDDPGLDDFFKDITNIFEKRDSDIRDIISYIKKQISEGAVEISLNGTVVWKR